MIQLKTYMDYTSSCLKNDSYGMLDSSSIVNLIEVCDNIMYETFLSVLVPDIKNDIDIR